MASLHVEIRVAMPVILPDDDRIVLVGGKGDLRVLLIIDGQCDGTILPLGLCDGRFNEKHGIPCAQTEQEAQQPGECREGVPPATSKCEGGGHIVCQDPARRDVTRGGELM